MLMKLFVPPPNCKVVSRIAARNAALVNQLATPGLGSLMAGQWIVGIGQLLLAVAGFVLVIVWFFETLIQLYGQMDDNVTSHPVAWIGETGAALFIVAWFWSLITSISLVVRAKSEEPVFPQPIPPRITNPPDEPSKRP
jgi:hypothetical protein